MATRDCRIRTLSLLRALSLEKILWNRPEGSHPFRWPRKRKWVIVVTLQLMTCVVSLASSMFAPALEQIMLEFGERDDLKKTLLLSIYTMGLIFGPLVVAPASEMYGRLLPSHSSNAVFICSTIGCAVSKSSQTLTFFRFVQGAAAAGVINLGGATIADVFQPEERARAMSIYTFAALLGPSIGPVAGAFIAASVGWRWTFWVLLFMGIVTSFLVVIFIPESYHPVLVAREATQREGTDFERVAPLPQKIFDWHVNLRPLFLLVKSRVVLLLSVYMAIGYGYQYLFFTTIPDVFVTRYHFAERFTGLPFISMGIGLLASVIGFGIMSDRLLVRYAVKERSPEVRLLLMIPGSLVIPCSLILYGWSAEYKLFYLVPMIGLCLFGFGLNITLMSCQMYLVDAFGRYSASALAAGTFLRAISGTLLPFAGPSMYSKLGIGWGNSVLALVSLCLCPTPFILLHYGPRLQYQNSE